MIAEVLSDRGQGAPLIYVPGIDGSGRLLLGTAARLEERFRLVCLNYRTDHAAPASDQPYADLAASVVRCLDELELSRAVVLAESFGGAVALQAALDHPGRVAGLALVNTFAYHKARVRLALARAVVPLIPNWLFGLGRRWAGVPAMFGSRREDQASRGFLAVPLTGFSRDYRQRLHMIAGLDLRHRLPEIEQPVALFVGDRDRVIDSQGLARELQAGLRDEQLTVIAGGGHLVLPLSRLPWVDWLEKLCDRAGLAAH